MDVEQFYTLGIVSSQPRIDVYGNTMIHIGSYPKLDSYFLIPKGDYLSIAKSDNSGEFYCTNSTNNLILLPPSELKACWKCDSNSLHWLMKYASLYRTTKKFDLVCRNQDFNKYLVDKDLYNVVEAPTTGKQIIISGTDDNITFRINDEFYEINNMTFNLNPSTFPRVIDLLTHYIASNTSTVDDLIERVEVLCMSGLCTDFRPKTDNSVSGIRHFMTNELGLFNAFYRILSRWINTSTFNF